MVLKTAREYKKETVCVSALKRSCLTFQGTGQIVSFTYPASIWLYLKYDFDPFVNG